MYFRLRQYAEERKKMNERNEEKKKKGPLKTDKKKVSMLCLLTFLFMLLVNNYMYCV